MTTSGGGLDAARIAPSVSIGMPVFNGEAYVGQAIRSVLDQTYGDLEIIVSDNASTDATEAICRELARQDGRIRYVRNARNLGAAANYNRCFALARGRFFKWAAHDDLLAPDFLARAVAALETMPEAVLCTVGVTEIDAAGHPLRRYTNHFPGIGHPRAARRFAAVIHTRHQCEDFFGLFRRAALEGSGLHGAYNGSDRVLLAEMALRGPWASVAEPVFLHREHPGRYTRAILLKDRQAAARWQDPDSPPRVTNGLFHSLVYARYCGLVARNVAAPAERAACYAELLRWWFTDDHLADMLRDGLRRVPPLAAMARAVRARLWRGATPAEARPGSLPELK